MIEEFELFIPLIIKLLRPKEFVEKNLRRIGFFVYLVYQVLIFSFIHLYLLFCLRRLLK